MICFAKPVLTEDLCIVQKQEFSVTYVQIHLFVREMLHKDYDRKGSAEKKSLVVSLYGLGAKMN
jgi:hypothetical protein